MRANLHLHSLRSDGTLRPYDIAAAASAVGLEAAALTDHDTLGGVPEFLSAARRLGLAAWPGVEMDVADKVSGFKGEVLAYFPSGSYKATRRFLSAVLERRRDRARLWMTRVPDVFFRSDLSYRDLERFKAELLGEEEHRSGEYSLGKIDLFRYLKARSALPSASEYREFKKAFFDTDLLPSGKYRKSELVEAVQAVHLDGGLCVAPHLGHEFNDDAEAMRKNPGALASLLGRFRDLGVRGVEMYHYRNGDSEGINRIVRNAASDLGLFLTYGSDCHGPGSGKYSIRDFFGEFQGWPEG